MKLTRKVQLNLNYCTSLKKDLLVSVMLEYNDIVSQLPTPKGAGLGREVQRKS